MSQSYARAAEMWSQKFEPGTDLCAEIAVCIDAAVAEERAAVVAWLRSDEPHRRWADSIGGSEYTCAADAIERGEHRRGE